MKGIFFTELLEMIESERGLAVVDRVIATAVPPTVGVFTSMGNYSEQEFFGLVKAFAAISQQPEDNVLRLFGRNFFRCILDRNEKLLDNYPTTIKALEQINEIVRTTRIFSLEKKRPEAQFTQVAPMVCQLLIRSKFPVQHIVHGAIDACIAHYDEPLEISMTENNLDGENSIRFDISPKAPSCLTTFN